MMLATIPNTTVGDMGGVDEPQSNRGKSEGKSESLPIMMQAGRSSFGASSPTTSGGLEVVNDQQVNLEEIEDLPIMMFERQQSLDDVSLSDLWPRPILSRSCLTQGTCDTGRRLHSGPPTTILRCPPTYIEPNQGPLATAHQELPSAFHDLRQQMQLGHPGLKVDDYNYHDPYASQRVSLDAEAPLRDLIASWETATGSCFTPTSTTTYGAEMTPITQSQIVHAAIQVLSHPIRCHASTKGDLLPSCLVGHRCFEDNDERTFHEHHAQQWDESFHELLQYREKYGNCQVPHGFSDNPSLARWVKRQRYQYKLMKCGKPSTMNVERASRLDAIGFIWDSHNSVWDERISQIRAFMEQYGHAPIPKTCKRDTKLSNWIKQQRRQYTLFCQGRPSTITLERIEQLQSLGFKWCHRRRAA